MRVLILVTHLLGTGQTQGAHAFLKPLLAQSIDVGFAFHQSANFL